MNIVVKTNLQLKAKKIYFFIIVIKKGIKVLFIYPNTFGMNMLPPAIALFSAILKKEGHEVEVFDTTYYAVDHDMDSDGRKMEKLQIVPYNMASRGIKMHTSDWKKDLKKKVDQYQPDLLSLSCTEDMWVTVMFEDMGTQLPPLTRGLISFADFVSSFWWIILIMIIVLSIAFSRFIQLENGRLIFDRIKIRLPLIGKVFNSFAIIRFTQTMATLMENGVTLLPALRVVKDTIGNKVYSNAVSSAEQEIERGSTLARELERNKVFPPVVMHMISVGEESGSPQQMMSKLSEYYDLETKKNLERLTSLVGPLVILFMGVIIGLIAFAIIDPILKMSASIG